MGACRGPLPTITHCGSRSLGITNIHKSLFEVGTEGLALVALDLSVLHGHRAQVVIHLGGVDGGRPLLILARFLAQPVVDVIAEAAPSLACLQDTSPL